MAAVRPIHHKDISSLWGEGRSVVNGPVNEDKRGRGEFLKVPSIGYPPSLCLQPCSTPSAAAPNPAGN